MTDDLFLITSEGDGPLLGVQTDNQPPSRLDYRIIPSFQRLLSTINASDLLAKLNEAKREPLPDSAPRLAPQGNYEVWAAGVTYKRSQEARERESNNSTIYTRVYDAKRPELFMKAVGTDVVGSGQPVGIRADATWSVPEPELVIVLNRFMEVIGFTIGNDMSSRDIEGANPLYLPQAKVYERSCAVGPRIWLQPGATTWPDVQIAITINRAGAAVFEGKTDTGQIHRTLADLVHYLGRAKHFANGVLLFTGTGIVPPDTFTLQAGDEVRVRIDPIGELVNSVITVGTADPL